MTADCDRTNSWFKFLDSFEKIEREEGEERKKGFFCCCVVFFCVVYFFVLLCFEMSFLNNVLKQPKKHSGPTCGFCSTP